MTVIQVSMLLQVAAAIGISERQLSRVFAADGISVPRHILERRLQLARALLSSTAHAERASTVAEIAGRFRMVRQMPGRDGPPAVCGVVLL